VLIILWQSQIANAKQRHCSARATGELRDSNHILAFRSKHKQMCRIPIPEHSLTDNRSVYRSFMNGTVSHRSVAPFLTLLSLPVDKHSDS
jgi:hypothetical protein